LVITHWESGVDKMIIIKIQAGLGNQLFQYATARALTLKLNTELKVDLSFYNDPKDRNAYRLNLFNLPISLATSEEIQKLRNRDHIPFIFRVLNKIGLGFSPFYKSTHILDKGLNNKRIRTVSKDFYLEGWFANEKYFIEYRDVILTDILPKINLDNINQSVLKEIQGNNTVSIHIRRGDYLTNGYFKILPKEYYNEAISAVKRKIENPVFFFFSNDPEWVKKEFAFLPEARFIEYNSTADTEYSTTGDINDLYLMSSCKHQVIANSTFSWWGAWLNNNISKQVFFPAIYYNNKAAQEQFEKSNLMPKNWHKIYF
jgi:hypothetical protein